MMKNVKKNMSAIALLALAMAALMPQKAQAQERIPFLAEGKTWTVFNYDARKGMVVKDSAYSWRHHRITKIQALRDRDATVPAYQEGLFVL